MYTCTHTFFYSFMHLLSAMWHHMLWEMSTSKEIQAAIKPITLIDTYSVQWGSHTISSIILTSWKSDTSSIWFWSLCSLLFAMNQVFISPQEFQSCHLLHLRHWNDFSKGLNCKMNGSAYACVIFCFKIFAARNTFLALFVWDFVKMCLSGWKNSKEAIKSIVFNGIIFLLSHIIYILITFKI